MAKLQRRCLHCGKVGDVKYQWGTANPGDDNEYFCSEECALKCFAGASETKCGHCGKTLCDGNGVYGYSPNCAYSYPPLGKIYCSAKCFLADRNCIPIEEVNKDKEANNG